MISSSWPTSRIPCSCALRGMRAMALVWVLAAAGCGLSEAEQTLLGAGDTLDLSSGLTVASDWRVLDAAYYLRRYPDLRAAYGTNTALATQHWLAAGAAEGRNGSLGLDVKMYMYRYADLRTAFGTNYLAAVNHFASNGLAEGRGGSVAFDAPYYLSKHADLRAALGATGYQAAYRHWLDNGIREGRAGSAFLDPVYYLGSYADLRQAFGPTNYRAAVEHYVMRGRSEGRIGSGENPDIARTQVATTPVPFATTNGDILTLLTGTMRGRRVVVIGGNFSILKLPNGSSVTASNFAVLDQENPNLVLYTGRGIDSYVRTLAFGSDRLYIGGDFSFFEGVQRNRTAALSATDFSLAPWNPGSSSRVSALAANSNSVFIGSTSSVQAVDSVAGQFKWVHWVSGGGVRALLLNPEQTELFVGGLFATIGDFAQHGLAKIKLSDNSLIRSFRPAFVPNSGVGSQGGYDGENPMSLAWDARSNPPRLVVGSGGIRNSLRWMSPNTGAGEWNGPWGADTVRWHEGDVQAVAVVGDVYVTGFHRNHGNTLGWNVGRFQAMWSAYDGSLQRWNPGFWGNQLNADGGNNGVQAMAYDASTRRLFVGGAFLGYGDTSPDLTGTAGVRWQSLAVLSVQ